MCIRDRTGGDADPGNKGFLAFSTAACHAFSGTWSCPRLGLRDVAIRGVKTSAHAGPGPSPPAWADFAAAADAGARQECGDGAGGDGEAEG